MKPAKTFQTLPYPHSWQDLSMGPWLAKQLQLNLDDICRAHFGYHLLKLGPLSAELNCHSSQIPHQVNVGDVGALYGVQAELGALPFQEASVDLCLLAHCLDYCNDPHQVLREVERVLTADGVVILSGFNPFSYLGLKRFLPYFRKQLPWSARMFTPQRVKDWLNVLGFELLEQRQFAYLTMGGNVNNMELAQRCCKSLAFVYIIVAKKRRSRLTPIKNRWQFKRSLVPELKGVPRAKFRAKYRLK